MTSLLGPRSTERVADGGVGLAAVLDSPRGFGVDGGGLVQGPDARWVLDWWIGADDRWHLPAREPTVRQRLRGCGPVTETAVRVPSGDVIQTVHAALVDGRTVAVVEVENQSPVPVALAIALRPYTLDGEPGDLVVERISPTEYSVQPHRLTLPRPPNEAGFAGDHDLLGMVEAGRSLSWPDRAAGAANLPFPNAVVMVPVPHRTTYRYCLGPADLNVDVDQLPGPDSVARGWNAVVESGGRFEFPDGGLAQLAGAARARLLLMDDRLPGVDGDLGTVLAALAESGHGDRLGNWLPDLIDELLGHGGLSPADEAGSARAAALVDGLSRALVVRRDQRSADEALPSLLHLTRALESRLSKPTRSVRAREAEAPGEPARHWCRAATALAVLVSWLGQEDAAAGLRRRMSDVANRIEATGHEDSEVLITAGGPAPTGGRVGHDELIGWSQQANLIRRWYGSDRSIGSGPEAGLVDAAAFWRAARHLLLTERVELAEPTIELVPDHPASWRGGSLEVHQAATLYGPLSYAIRWHGPRPALLWDASECRARIVCSSLDPEWSTLGDRGETLLAGVADGLDHVPGPGDSFS